MYTTLIQLSDGTEITSGAAETTYIRDAKIIESVNSGNELTLGSACATEVTLTIVSTDNTLSIASGEEFTVYKVDDAGTRTKIGVFNAEKPTKSSANAYKVTGYDKILKLEKDVSAWLSTLDGWPYTLSTFAQMVCTECGVNFVTKTFTNADFPVNPFEVTSVTGRRIMEWVGQLAARFVRATVDGGIELAWYTQTDITVGPNGDSYYFGGGLQYENYKVSPIEGVQIRLADSDAGELWPEALVGSNTYVIKNNRLITSITDATKQYLRAIETTLGSFTYTPCKVSMPTNINIHAGSIINLVTLHGITLTTYVMSKTQSGQRDDLECTGSARRDDADAYDDDPRNAADDAAEGALKRQSQLDVFNKLTNNGQSQGLFIDDKGQVWINASYISTGVLASKDGETFYLDLDEGILDMKARSLSIQGQSVSDFVLDGLSQQDIVDKLTANGAAEGIYLKDGQLYINANYIISGVLNASLITAGTLQSKDGKTFVLDLDKGTLQIEGSGKITSADGNSYIVLEGNEFVLYAKEGEYGDFVPIAQIGFTEDSEGYDYPYFQLGHVDNEDSDSDKMGLMKMFKNGMYLGNAVPKNSTGSFLGLPGAAGFFIDTLKGVAYTVDGTDLTDVSTAKFA